MKSLVLVINNFKGIQSSLKFETPFKMQIQIKS